ncbi:hypothetical protein [Curvibacter lanceolatus]|uniref:hypothetical protein n=1 Tax=Curvibacter lanceolatus TaxID=86182 RepID=UPI0012F9BA81|nr:hypothetical protein [Curvibacter lanceolatus]
MPMPLAWLDRIFDKLTVTYGSAFLDRWRDVDIAKVKTDWLDVLDGMEKHPEAIAFALQNLTEKPPTVIEFRNLCRRAPMPEAPRLEAPKADPERIKAEIAKLGPVREAVIRTGGADPKAWAKRLMDRHNAGEKLNPIQIRFAREALEPA